ncbi:MAG: DnaA regulatory inactivator Hda [Pseudomonadota bacterium]|nr:DnaA regulatory inactivator Hda [Pseudomonadota bacterium]
MRQLALDLKLADHARFQSYLAGPNDIAVQAIQKLANSPNGEVIWLWGAFGSGRSHLLQSAIANAAENNLTCAWLPLGSKIDLAPGLLEGMGNLDLVCIDDIDCVAGQSEWEKYLFILFEDLREYQSNLIISASLPPSASAFQMKDLKSRLASGSTWKLMPLSDEQKIEALKLRANWRGFELPHETALYLFRRVERSNQALFSLLDELDNEALRSKRRLTIPFVKNFLKLST